MYVGRKRKGATRGLIVVLSLMMCFALIPVQNVKADPSGFSGAGSGIESDPYVIMTAEQLDELRNDMQAHYQLGADIDLAAYLSDGGTGYAKWGASGWDPIGYVEDYCFPDPFIGEICSENTYAFTGSFDGNGYTISNLKINTTEDYSGLFGIVAGAHFEDVKLEDVDIAGASFTGGLIGEMANSGTIEHSYVTGSVEGVTVVGGLAGRINNGSIVRESYADVDVTSTIGGYVGGLVGTNYADIENSYATGNVVAYNQAGGLVGVFATGTIMNSYATGAVTGNSDTGGLIGKMNTGTVTSSYYDVNTTGQSDTGKGIGKTTAEMHQEATFTGSDSILRMCGESGKGSNIRN
ncbi:GLUG motif-containing protein [Marinicrinis sediminis]|uniref:GLUG motif-containing protein n=1 Tax=Marinicrinis sediminis TaxID=1652465 RepID=A0ABW5RBF2_9BACL